MMKKKEMESAGRGYGDEVHEDSVKRLCWKDAVRLMEVLKVLEALGVHSYVDRWRLKREDEMGQLTKLVN